jgi:hypothetical protein
MFDAIEATKKTFVFVHQKNLVIFSVFFVCENRWRYEVCVATVTSVYTRLVVKVTRKARAVTELGNERIGRFGGKLQLPGHSTFILLFILFFFTFPTHLQIASFSRNYVINRCLVNHHHRKSSSDICPGST